MYASTACDMAETEGARVNLIKSWMRAEVTSHRQHTKRTRELLWKYMLAAASHTTYEYNITSHHIISLLSVFLVFFQAAYTGHICWHDTSVHVYSLCFRPFFDITLQILSIFYHIYLFIYFTQTKMTSKISQQKYHFNWQERSKLTKYSNILYII